MPKTSKAFAPGSKPGSGARFKACTERLSHRKGIHNAKAVCASIGRRKYGAVKFQRMARGHAAPGPPAAAAKKR